MIESVQKGNAQSGTITDQKVRSIELLISGLLRGGALASLVFILAGSLLIPIDHPDYLRSPEELHQLLLPGAIFPHTIADVGREALHLRGPALVMVGLLLLIVTPVLLVAVSILMFAYQRDRDFVMITFLVLMLLVTSFLLGTTEHSPPSAPANQRGKGMDVKVGSAVGSGQKIPGKSEGERDGCQSEQGYALVQWPRDGSTTARSKPLWEACKIALRPPAA